MMFRRKVQTGKRLGRTIGFPTLNFEAGNLSQHYNFGVYACRIWIGGKEYRGALHFGPKWGSRKKAHLEIHVLGFNKTIYGTWVTFEFGKKIRRPKKFESVEALKKQIESDVKKIK